MLGCLLFGLVWALAEERRLLTPAQRIWLSAGFLGGFTTFSSFGYETIEMIRQGESMRAGVHVLVQNTLGPLAVLLGYTLGERP